MDQLKIITYQKSNHIYALGSICIINRTYYSRSCQIIHFTVSNLYPFTVLKIHRKHGIIKLKCTIHFSPVLINEGAFLCRILGAAKMGMHFVGLGPQELAKEMDGALVKRVFATARENGGLIEITDDMNSLKDADVIYGDIWASMGEEDLIPERAKLLSPYRVTEETLKATGNPNVLYMHCLPSFHDFETKLAKEWHDKGVDIREVSDEVFRSRHSVVFDEAENRMHSIKAVLVATIGK